MADYTKIVVFSGFTALSLGITVFLNRLYKDTSIKYKKIKAQKYLLTPGRLVELPQSPKAYEVKFVALEGVLMPNIDYGVNTHPSVVGNEFAKRANKVLNDENFKPKCLFKIQYDQDSADRIRQPHHHLTRFNQFYIVDPQIPEKYILASPFSNTIQMNLRQSIKLVERHQASRGFSFGITASDLLGYDRVSYLAYEGSTVSVLGLLCYNGKSWQIKDIYALIGGGFRECVAFMKSEVSQLRDLKNLFIGLTSILAGITMYFSYQKYVKRQTEYLLKN